MPFFHILDEDVVHTRMPKGIEDKKSINFVHCIFTMPY